MCFFVSKKGINFSDAKLHIFFGTAKKMWLDDKMLEGEWTLWRTYGTRCDRPVATDSSSLRMPRVAKPASTAE